MKNALKIAVCLIVMVSFAGCTSIIVKAPQGKNIQMASGNAPSEYNKSKMVWYILWGLVPLGDNSTADLLTDAPDGSKVFVKSEMSVLDAIVSALLGFITIQTRTVSVAVQQ